MLFKKLAYGLGILEDVTGAATDSSISSGTISNNNAAIKTNREAIGQEEDALQFSIEAAEEDEQFAIDSLSEPVRRSLDKIDKSRDSNPSGFMFDGEQEEMLDELEAQTQQDYGNKLQALTMKTEKFIQNKRLASLNRISALEADIEKRKRQNQSLKKSGGFLSNLANRMVS
jgi:hypothetical protein|tara:strand:- start:3621 stop:4136 length:516 start_codon:yes stop_codon:yes gene_type:complete